MISRRKDELAMPRRLWTRDELQKVLSLYCQIPFGRMHSTNPAVHQLGLALGRSPSAVAMKLVNFSSLDPELQDRGIVGMAHVSQLDRELWEEFYGQWNELADSFIIEPSRLQFSEINESDSLASTEATREVKTRVGQRFFRNAVLAASDWKCCITNIETLELLRASHILAWASNVENRLNPRNGLCLNALHDAAFDRGLIAIGSDFRLLVSSRLTREVPQDIYEAAFARFEGKPIRLPERFRPDPRFLERHLESRFVA